MDTRLYKTTLLLVIGLITLGAAGISSAARRAVSLTQDPLVMRLSKDEFRIAFGINADRGAPNGCNGVIRYRVDWKTEDGMTRSEVRMVNYTVSPRASRAMTVDRQYFDTGEGQHTTDVIKVSVDRITCLDSGDSHVPQLASAAIPVAAAAARLQ
ncbi:MAG TPA: hypothetical protein VHN17_00935 [Steroidobacteraceae bacterium]|jgi:hypothetical protein|nr:hypothetical protein [Steroidobacteraceae bacterium]